MSVAPFTGAKVFAFTASAFAVIIAVNGLLAYKAISTFPGLEVDNSYVASQTFDAELQAQKRMGWALAVTASAAEVTLTFTGAGGQPVQPQSLSATIGRATEAVDDRVAAFSFAAGRYAAPVDLAPGKWVLRVEARAADGTVFRQRVALNVKG